MQTPNAFLAPAVAILFATSAHAEFTNGQVPPFRGQPNTGYAQWESFTVPFGGVNTPDVPGATTDATVENLTPSAFLIPPPAGNIYSPDQAIDLVLAGSVQTPLLEVWLQTSTKGAELDYTDITLNYTDADGLPQSAPYDERIELAFIPSAGVDVESLFRWDLTSVSPSITDYTITFRAAEPSVSLDAVILDTRSDEPPSVYCTALVNSAGCTPQIGFTGLPTAGAGSFDITATEILESKPGLLFYGVTGPAAIPFQSGTLCMIPPLRRTPLQFSGPSALACGGSFSFDFQALIAGGTNAQLVPGQQVQAQYWSRDPALAPNFSSLTDAVQFTVF